MRGVSAEEIQRGLETFQGIKRRMEVRGVERGVTVIDDFAHHPTAIDTTLAGAKRRYPGQRIWALFEPRSISSSRKEFENGYIDAFHQADRVIIGPIFHKGRYETRYGLDKMMSVADDRRAPERRRHPRRTDRRHRCDRGRRRARREGGRRDPGDVVRMRSKACTRRSSSACERNERLSPQRHKEHKGILFVSFVSLW